MTLDRRDLIKRIAALAAIPSSSLLVACADQDAAPDGPFALWRKIRTALTSSPDHLQMQAQAAINGADLRTIFEFVRDNIVVRPWAEPTHRVQIQTAGHVGQRGVLRSGFATAREKAELLHAMLTDAGYVCEIVDGEISLEALGGYRLFTSQVAPAFSPDLQNVRLDQWFEALSIDTQAGMGEIDWDQTQAPALADSLLNAIPMSARGDGNEVEALQTWLPLVRVNVDGQLVYANPQIPQAELGEHYCLGSPRPSPVQQPIETPKLKVSLAIATRRNPRRPETVLQGEWAVGDLVGRRLQLRFRPTQLPEDLLALRLQQIQQFQPCFLVAGSDITESDADHLARTGDVITVEGDRLDVADGTLTVGQRQFALGDADPALAKTVQAIDLHVNASQYPRLVLDVGLRDGIGTALPELPLSVFAISHDDEPVAPLLTRNTARAPKIAFALDFSTSLPEQYQGTKVAPLIERMCREISNAAPKATFRTGSFAGGGAGSAMNWFGGWQANADAIRREIEQQGATAASVSSYFSALADATNSGASVVILITDADGSSSNTAEIEARISEGCPAVVIGLPSAMTRTEHLDRLSELSGGHLFGIDTIDQAIAAAATLAANETARPYRFELVVDSTSETRQRTVTLSIPAANQRRSLSYEPPERSVESPRALSGLYLTIELGRRRIVRRLAGYPIVSGAVQPLEDAHVQAARLGLFGLYELSIEGSAPTAAAALDDALYAAISAEPLVAAAKTRDEAAILEASASGIDKLPDRWLALNTPLPGRLSKDRLSFQAGYRMVLFSDVPTPAGDVQRKADILPFHDWRTIASENDRYTLNVRHTLQLSLLEQANYEVSTVAKLGDSALIAQRGYEFNAWVSRIDDPALRQAWQLVVADRGTPRLPHHLLLPVATDRPAYWTVDLETGAVLGMLPDGSGGASEADTNRTFELLAKVIDAYAEILQKLMTVPPGFMVWAQLEKAKLEHLRRATIAIIRMDGTFTSGYGELLEAQVTDWINARVRGAIDGALGRSIGGYAETKKIVGLHNQIQSVWERVTSGG